MEVGSYENMQRLVCDAPDTEADRAVFIPVCGACGRFVKADAQIRFTVTPGDWVSTIEPVKPNATCKKCGRVAMIFEGFG